MAINLNHSRRNAFNLCRYWKRKTKGYGDANELIYNETPRGYFYAKPMASKNKQLDTIQGVMMLEKDNITLKTTDNIKDIAPQDIVQYKGELWFVNSVQYEEVIKESQFIASSSYIYYISLRK